MNMKKILSLVLALALCVSIFAACGNGGDSSTSSTGGESSAAADGGEGSDAADSEPIDVLNQEETMDLTITIMDGYKQADSEIEKWLEEMYNVNITLNVLPGYTDGASQIQLIMAGDELPDTIWWWSMDTQYQQWVDAGLLVDVAPYIEKYPNIRQEEQEKLLQSLEKFLYKLEISSTLTDTEKQCYQQTKKFRDDLIRI